jgi:hypothetical protein
MRLNEFFSIYLIPPAALGPKVYSASNRIEYQKQKIMFLGSRARPVRKADNLTAICEPIVYTMWDLNISRPPRPITGIALLVSLQYAVILKLRMSARSI